MNKPFIVKKLLPLWISVSTVILIAGIVLFVLFGFNHAKDDYKTFEVTYSATVSINNKEEDIERFCEDAFKANGFSFESKTTDDALNPNNFASTGEYVLRYTLSGKTKNTALDAAKKSVEEKLASDALYTDVAVEYHAAKAELFYTSAWRAAIALGVGVVVVLVYMAFRFGLSNAIAGLVGVIHDAALTLAILALTRIPVYAFTPVLFAAIAAFLSVLFWTVRSMMLRVSFKDPANLTLTAQEVVEKDYAKSCKTELIVSGVLAAILVVLGAVAVNGVRLFMLPALIPVAVATYSSLILSTAVFIPIKTAFMKAKEKRNIRYSGKQKAE